MHIYDVLYRGLNLTEPSQDGDGLLRTAVAVLAAEFVLAAMVSLLPMSGPAWLGVALTVVFVAAIIPVTVAVFAHATGRARRIRCDDVVEISLLDAAVAAEPSELRLSSANCLFTVRRRGDVWRRRERSSSVPFTVTLPLDDASRGVVADWVFGTDGEVTATASFHPGSPGRVDDLARIQLGDAISFRARDDVGELAVEF